MSFYSGDVVYFDLVPPLKYEGAGALRVRFLDWFERFDGAIRQRISDLCVTPGNDTAYASMLIEAGGTLRGGRNMRYWVRATSCFERYGPAWWISHEHVSLPVDLESGAAVFTPHLASHSVALARKTEAVASLHQSK